MGTPAAGERQLGKPGGRSTDLLKALNHPTRIEILTILNERIASPKELTDELGGDLPLVAYHVRVLLKYDLVEIVDEAQRRGATEHYYRAKDRAWFDDEEFHRFDPHVKQVIVSYGADRLFTELRTALAAGTFDAEPLRHLSRTPLVLDRLGWERVSAICEEALEAVLAEGVASEERRDVDDETISAVLGVLCFPMPDPDAPPPRS